MATEQQTAAAQQIYNFYNTIVDLRHHNALYRNFVKELEFKHGVNLEQVSDEEKSIFNDQGRTMRYIAYVLHVQYKSMREKLKVPAELDKKIEEVYLRVDNALIPAVKNTDEYCQLFNDLLVTEVVQELLSTSDAFVKSLLNTQGEEEKS